MAYRIKHLPTGLYYQPVGGSGNNLSKKGKLYHQKTGANRVISGGKYVSLQAKKDSRVYKDTQNIIDWKDSWSQSSVYFHSPVADWEIETFQTESEACDIMSAEAVKKRKDNLKEIRKIAVKVWEDCCHEGDPHEKEYWIRGFIASENFRSNN